MAVFPFELSFSLNVSIDEAQGFQNSTLFR